MQVGWPCIAVLVGACSFEHGAASGGTGGPGDGGSSDTPLVDGSNAGAEPQGLICYGTGLGVQVCPAMMPNATYVLSGQQTVNTDMGSGDCAALLGPTANDYCAIVATQITISGRLIGNGSRPLVLVSTSTILMSGQIDVASHRSGHVRGAGGDAGTCGSADSSASTGGGAGGSFATAGGKGGNSPGGVPGLGAAPTTLRGGCPGTIGKDYLTGVSPPPGRGGGAVDLIAVTSITISGVIDASGAGGNGALITRNGGQGGGSGGMIVMDSPSVMFNMTPMLFANGGGGGGGSNVNLNGNGGDGQDPSGPGSGGGHGGGASGSGDGGDGAAGTQNGGDGRDGSSGNGNGGGGGGVGAIRVFQSGLPSGGNVSPPMS